VTWGQELAIALKQCNAAITSEDDDIDLIKVAQPKVHGFGGNVKSTLRDVWKEGHTDVFDIGYVLLIFISRRCFSSFLL